VDLLRGDASKARGVLGWEPKISFEELVAMMIEADRRLAQEERLLADHRSPDRAAGGAKGGAP